MFKHLQTSTTHSVNLWGMMRRIVRLKISCMKYQETHIKFKVKYNRKEMLRSLTLQEEKTLTLVVEAWVEVEVRSFVVTAHN
jgi:hypothetical protein